MKKIALSLTIILALLGTGFAQNNTKADHKEVKYVKIEVDGLACPFCAYGIEKNLKKVKNAKDVQVFLKGGYATFQVPSDEVPSKEALEKIVEDAGFQARKIIFSDKVFAASDNGKN